MGEINEVVDALVIEVSRTPCFVTIEFQDRRTAGKILTFLKKQTQKNKQKNA